MASGIRMLALAAAVAAFSGSPAAAQGRMGGVAGGMGPQRAEQALRLRETLDLTADQVQKLEALRAQQVEHRQARSEEAIALRSRVAAGDVTPEDARAQFRALMQAGQGPEDGALREILTDEQLGVLNRQHMMGARAAGARQGQRGAVQGMRGGNGMRGAPGMRGGQGVRQGLGAGQGIRGGMLPGGQRRVPPPAGGGSTR